jgi:hypothetical protein
MFLSRGIDLAHIRSAGREQQGAVWRKGRILEVLLPPGGAVEGAVLVNHLKSLD